VLDVGDMSWFDGGNTLTKPKKLYNNYFDFSSLMSPTAYTPAQQKAAQVYVDFLSKSYNPLTDGIKFSDLQAALNKQKSDPKKLATTLNTFVNSAQFKQYQLMIRSYLASQSVATSNFNYL